MGALRLAAELALLGQTAIELLLEAVEPDSQEYARILDLAGAISAARIEWERANGIETGDDD